MRGGVGFSWEHPTLLSLKRAKRSEALFDCEHRWVRGAWRTSAMKRSVRSGSHLAMDSAVFASVVN